MPMPPFPPMSEPCKGNYQSLLAQVRMTDGHQHSLCLEKVLSCIPYPQTHRGSKQCPGQCDGEHSDPYRGALGTGGDRKGHPVSPSGVCVHRGCPASLVGERRRQPSRPPRFRGEDPGTPCSSREGRGAPRSRRKGRRHSPFQYTG